MAVYSVYQINQYIKNMFDQDFVLENTSVEGEVSNCKYHQSGHIYFTLKDNGGVLSAVMFAGNRIKGLSFNLKDGMKVVVTGRISVYEAAGKYQIYASKIEQSGRGELYGKYLELKSKLEEMGMFDPMYKKKIPENAGTIGVVTARTGAAVHDIISVSRRRNPGIKIILYPASVQGKDAAPDICKGIKMLDAMGTDVIIVGRGGGSIEDLWAFNEEIVAQAVFECNTPVISAVGHETDFTIIDFVSDERAPTPSAAAEMAVKDIGVNKSKIREFDNMMKLILRNRLGELRNRISEYNRKIKYFSPVNSLNNKRLRLDELADRLNYLINDATERKRAYFKVLAARLNGASPLSKLESGFSYVTDINGTNLSQISDFEIDKKINIRVRNGEIKACVNEIVESEDLHGN